MMLSGHDGDLPVVRRTHAMPGFIIAYGVTALLALMITMRYDTVIRTGIDMHSNELLFIMMSYNRHYSFALVVTWYCIRTMSNQCLIILI